MNKHDRRPLKSSPASRTSLAYSRIFILTALIILALIFPDLQSQQAVTGFTLIDAGTNQPIRILADKDTIDPAKDGAMLSIRADTDPAVVGSVVFKLDGATVRTESVAPYSFSGDNSGDYNAMDLGPGSHTLSATPYSAGGGGGTAGTSLSIGLYMKEGGGGSEIPGGPATPPADPGSGEVLISGEMMQWHKITLNINGPACDESDTDPNPFLDLRLEALFSKGELSFRVPGYFAADGDAANTGASQGNTWRVHFAPVDTGTWNYTLSLRLGRNVAVNDSLLAGDPLPPVDGVGGTLEIAPSDKTGRDLRAHGLLQYVGEHYLRFAGTGEYFLKQGADAPENFLAYEDFDGDFKNDGIKDNLVKDWGPHVRDWRDGDPTWAGGKGKGIIGAVNYLASEGMNVFSFIPMNIGGDDRNVFPYTGYQERYHMDVSRLEQWEIVFEHGTRMGMYLHFKTQETENETLLDGGNLGLQRRLYYRELIARFSHHLALNWNLGEEINDQSLKQRQDMARYFWTHDPYQHHIVIHNGKKPDDMLGSASHLTGFSLQTNREDFGNVHSSVLEWVNKSANAGKPWVVACDEPGDASHALVPDKDDPTHDNARKNGLWGTFMAGGAGNEWYFGYQHDHSDLSCNDFRSRDDWWDQCLTAMNFFRDHTAFWEMKNHNSLTDADYCFASPGNSYVVFLKNGGNHTLNLQEGVYDVSWFNPRTGGKLMKGEPLRVSGPGLRFLGLPPSDPSKDWAVLLTRNTDGASGSDDAYLRTLTANPGTLEPAFSRYDTVYSLLLPKGSTSLSLVAEPGDPNASVDGAGSIEVSQGEAVAEIIVTSEDGTRTRIYKIEISVEPYSDNADLARLTLSPWDLDPSFSPAITEYTLHLPSGTDQLNISTLAEHSGASVTGAGSIVLGSADTTLLILVTAEDGFSTRTYSVRVVFEPTGAGTILQQQMLAGPNPASEKLIIHGSEPGSIILMINQQGQIVLRAEADADPAVLDIHHFPAGIYVIQLRYNYGIRTSRLMISR